MPKKKDHKKAPMDPFRAREAERYEAPIVSREAILQYLLDQAEGPIEETVIAKAFGVRGAEPCEALRRRLRAMVRDHQLVMHGAGFERFEAFPPIPGVVMLDREGKFWVKTNDHLRVRVYAPTVAESLFPGDQVLVQQHRELEEEGLWLGSVIKVLQHAKALVVGRYENKGHVALVHPQHHLVKAPIFVRSLRTEDTPQDDQDVVVELSRFPLDLANPVGDVVEVLVDRFNFTAARSVLYQKQIPCEWSPELEASLKKVAKPIAAKDRKGRKDLRSLPWVTIDGEDAKDFDDAVCVQKRSGGGWDLYVGIADVSHYVKPGTLLDEEAKNRGTSVYFPGMVVPMLPACLSDDLCSLKPETDRLALVCRMHISPEGQIKSRSFEAAVIHSHARLTYTVATAMVEGTAFPGRFDPHLPHLKTLHEVYLALNQARRKRHAIEFETTETQMHFNAQGRICQIAPVQRGVAHRIIELCMLAANESAAHHLRTHQAPVLYRAHPRPEVRKLTELKAFLRTRGVPHVPASDDWSHEDYNQVIQTILAREDGDILQSMVLRSMSQAFYTPEHQGHFGLAYDDYAHFTSPIRRYPDLLVHRSLHALIQKETMPPKKEWFAAYQAMGEHCSTTERRADEASRDVGMMLKCQYLEDKIGEVCEGLILGVTHFGLFVQLKPYLIEGLVHISKIGQDYYEFNPQEQSLTGERSGNTYHLGDAITVTIAGVDVWNKRIDLNLDEPDAPTHSRAPGKKKSASSGKGATRSAATSRKPRTRSPKDATAADKGKRPAKTAPTPPKKSSSAPEGALQKKRRTRRKPAQKGAE